MSMTFGNRGTASPEINVAPMVDVLLVLLIIFMVLFPYRSVGEQANIPLPTKTTEPSNPIVIDLKEAAGSRRPSLQINRQEVSWEDFGSRLENIYSRRADKVAFLKGDPEINFQYVADAIDLVHHAGVTQVGLMGN
jgi:biopolymer transport protein ExbD